MASLKVVRADGSESQHEITPAIEYALDQYAKKGFYRAFREDQKQTDIYWLAWECLRRSGTDVKPFGDAFLQTLKSVEVLGDDSPNG